MSISHSFSIPQLDSGHRAVAREPSPEPSHDHARGPAWRPRRSIHLGEASEKRRFEERRGANQLANAGLAGLATSGAKGTTSHKKLLYSSSWHYYYSSKKLVVTRASLLVTRALVTSSFLLLVVMHLLLVAHALGTGSRSR